MTARRDWEPEAPLGPDVPGAAEKCFPCYLAGHFCRATEWWFEVAVCRSCLDGAVCEQRASVERMLASKPDYGVGSSEGMA
jgi:hypothetical protein